MEENEAWNQRPDESDEAYQAFIDFLKAGSVPKVYRKCTKSKSLLKRWSAKFEWKSRARAYRSSILEAARREVISDFYENVSDHYFHNKKIIEKIHEVLEAKDLSKASLKSLNEALHSTFAEQISIINFLGDDTEKDNTLEIRVVDATCESLQPL